MVHKCKSTCIVSTSKHYLLEFQNTNSHLLYLFSSRRVCQ